MSLRFGILGLLKYESMTGYDLQKTFNSSLQFMWNAKTSQIYRELKTLESQQLVSSSVIEQESKFDRKVYTITTKGNESFLSWMQKFPQDLNAPIRDEFIMRIFFSEFMDDDEVSFEIRRYQKQQEDLLQILNVIKKQAVLDAKENSYERSLFYWLLTIKRAMKSIEAEKEWAEEALALIESRKG
ncbi:PadR family transcriptional regulator [Alkalihalophilus pseudofirmus]|uniref:PadR family transcriptional regulator n=1 Tax=Alkalihalophilus pseudofirmus TaxID=79885 RepID=UPI00259B3DCA|nr:PadR family transcriptional regulator [Alkalihalophilus pseudofirmus]WEG18888.1 PadR family transcriptional regulator [Alkalihalophilus pseudofirmus]